MTTKILPPSASKSPFVERLLAIRAEGVARTQRRAEHRSAKDVLHSQELVSSYAFLHDVERSVVAVLENISEELPRSAKVVRTFFDGRYHMVLRLEETLRDGEGELVNRFSRISFLLGPRAHDGRFEVEARATVRSRDLEGDLLETGMDEQGLASIEAFLETRVLSFAQHYFEIGEYTRVVEEQPDVGWMSDSLSI